MLSGSIVVVKVNVTARQRPAQTRPDDTDLALGGNNRCNNTALRKASRRVSQLYDAILAPSGLRQTQRSILMHIARAGTASLGKLAASLVLDRSALGHNLRPLERDGLLVIETDPDDRRSRRVKLTRKGESKLRETAVLWQAAQERFESKFGVGRAAALRDTLALIAAADFGDEPDGVPTPSTNPSSRTKR
jgi:DNA-binding MarR family transcriptional regulator